MRPLVSVVTPFHNTAKYLQQCIESVLEQKYDNFEYILVDNCSTDSSGEIAERYANRDSRIRLVRRPSLLSQVQNYNAALLEISAASKFTKIVQADDFIFTDCLERMVEAFERSERIGLVAAYDLKGEQVRGSGLPIRRGPFSGKEIAQLYLRSAVFVFGSPTSVMYRSSIIREQQPFYDESCLHEDTEKCMQILQHWDFGFAYQVLAFLRTDNESISGSVRHQRPHSLDRYIIVQRYASIFLDEQEARKLKLQSRRDYYTDLAEEVLRFRDRAFWRYHTAGLKRVGEELNIPYLITSVLEFLFWMAINPGETLRRILRYGKRRSNLQREPRADDLRQARRITS